MHLHCHCVFLGHYSPATISLVTDPIPSISSLTTSPTRSWNLACSTPAPFVKVPEPKNSPGYRRVPFDTCAIASPIVNCHLSVLHTDAGSSLMKTRPVRSLARGRISSAETTTGEMLLAKDFEC